MIAPLATTLVGGGLALILVVLFRAERARGTRFLAGARGSFDRGLEVLARGVMRRYPLLDGRTLRQTVHYLFHKALTAVLRLLARIEQLIERVVHVNRKSANRAVGKEAPNAHFSAIAAHKRSARLSDDEKRQRREDALNGH